MKKLRFQTENGSIYAVKEVFGKVTWKKEGTSDKGRLTSFPKVRVGIGAFLSQQKVTGGRERGILTSDVVKVF